MHGNPCPLLSHPTDFSFLLRPSEDINALIFRIFISFRVMVAASRSVDCYMIRTSSLTYVRRRAPYPSGYSLSLLGSALLLALALVHALSVALRRPFSSLLLSFAGDTSPSVGLPALLSRIPDSQNNKHPYRNPSVQNYRGTAQYLTLSVFGNSTGDFREAS